MEKLIKAYFYVFRYQAYMIYKKLMSWLQKFD